MITQEKMHEIAYETQTTNAMQSKKRSVSPVQSVSKQFIVDFAKKASKDDFAWIRQRSAQLMIEKGSRYFPTFRAEFVRRFFPEKLTGKPVESLCDMLEEINQSV